MRQQNRAANLDFSFWLQAAICRTSLSSLYGHILSCFGPGLATRRGRGQAPHLFTSITVRPRIWPLRIWLPRSSRSARPDSEVMASSRSMGRSAASRAQAARARYSPRARDGTAELLRGKRGRSSSICSQAS